MSNYELSYWERKAIEELQKHNPAGYGLPRSAGNIYNNRKATRGRAIQVIKSKDGTVKQIRKPSLH